MYMYLRIHLVSQWDNESLISSIVPYLVVRQETVISGSGMTSPRVLECQQASNT